MNKQSVWLSTNARLSLALPGMMMRARVRVPRWGRAKEGRERGCQGERASRRGSLEGRERAREDAGVGERERESCKGGKNDATVRETVVREIKG